MNPDRYPDYQQKKLFDWSLAYVSNNSIKFHKDLFRIE